MRLIFLLLLLAACAAAPPGPSALPARVVDFPGGPAVVWSGDGPLALALDEFIGLLEERAVPAEGDLLAAAHPDGSGFDLLARVPVAVEVEAPLRSVRLEAARTATVLLRGPYAQVLARRADLIGWCSTNGWEPAGTMLLVLRVHAGWRGAPADYLTELHLPVR